MKQMKTSGMHGVYFKHLKKKQKNTYRSFVGEVAQTSQHQDEGRSQATAEAEASEQS